MWSLSPTAAVLQNTTAWGPFPDLTAADIAMGSDAKARLLWTETTGSAQDWRQDQPGTSVEKVFKLAAPVSGAVATKLMANLLSRSMWVLWTYPDGRTLLRKVDPSTGAVTTQYLYYTF